MKLNKRRFSEPARVELLPLIDVIFLLLIFFIFVMLTMSVKSAIKIELPKLVDIQQEPAELLMITIDQNNKLYINDIETKQAQLVAQVHLDQQQHRRPILIQGDQQSDLGVALQILDKLRAAGYNQVAFSAQKLTTSNQ